METNSNKLSESNIKLSINKSESNEILNNDSNHISNNISKNVDQEENNEDPEIEAQNYYNSLTPEEKKKLSSVITYIKGQNHQLNEKEIEAIFKKLDIHGNNKITFEDLQKFLSVLRSKVNNYYINEIIREYGQDSKEISKETFIEKMKDSIKGKYKKEDITELKEVFQLFDTNHDNKITYEDINNVMNALGETSFTDDMCKNMIIHLKAEAVGKEVSPKAFITLLISSYVILLS
jgi:Ca2+-binding EF-hand superfamily protein